MSSQFRTPQTLKSLPPLRRSLPIERPPHLGGPALTTRPNHPRRPVHARRPHRRPQQTPVRPPPTKGHHQTSRQIRSFPLRPLQPRLHEDHLQRRPLHQGHQRTPSQINAPKRQSNKKIPKLKPGKDHQQMTSQNFKPPALIHQPQHIRCLPARLPTLQRTTSQTTTSSDISSTALNNLRDLQTTQTTSTSQPAGPSSSDPLTHDQHIQNMSDLNFAQSIFDAQRNEGSSPIQLGEPAISPPPYQPRQLDFGDPQTTTGDILISTSPPQTIDIEGPSKLYMSSCILDKHAPIKRKMAPVHPDKGFVNSDILSAKRLKRKCERVWRSNNSAINRRRY